MMPMSNGSGTTLRMAALKDVDAGLERQSWLT
jgi:hypothetical protein